MLVLAGNTVAMVTYCVMKLITTYSSKWAGFFHASHMTHDFIQRFVLPQSSKPRKKQTSESNDSPKITNFLE